MNSEAVQGIIGLDPSGWKSWSGFDPDMAPPSAGLYLLRVAGGSGIERVKGASDIIYIGSGNIRDRLKAHANPDWKDFRDSGWLICLISRHRNLEVAWSEQSLESARSSEARLLAEFVAQHCELPPANRQMPDFDQVARARIVLLSLSQTDQTTLLQEFLRKGSLEGGGI